MYNEITDGLGVAHNEGQQLLLRPKLLARKVETAVTIALVGRAVTIALVETAVTIAVSSHSIYFLFNTSFLKKMLPDQQKY